MKASHKQTYSRLRQEHPRLFCDVALHRRSSRLGPMRKALYPIVYGGRSRRPWELRVKAVLDRSGIWTLRP